MTQPAASLIDEIVREPVGVVAAILMYEHIIAKPDDPDIVYKALFRHYRPTKPIVAAVALSIVRSLDWRLSTTINSPLGRNAM